ncbi:MAG: hypothetical protein HYY18_21645 [Planctomycetes bacterium]|nr:hypothetical protein [Planctomycetota bacterium]
MLPIPGVSRHFPILVLVAVAGFLVAVGTVVAVLLSLIRPGPRRPPEQQAADSFLSQMNTGFTSSTSLYAVDAVSESAGRARQATPGLWGRWTAQEVRPGRRLGPLESAEVLGTMRGADGVERACAVTLVNFERWLVAEVAVGGTDCLPAPLQEEDRSKPQILHCVVQAVEHERSEHGIRVIVLVRVPTSGSGAEAEPSRLALTAIAQKKDGTRTQPGEFRQELAGPASGRLVALEFTPGWRFPSRSARVAPDTFLSLRVEDLRTKASSTREAEIP